MENLGENSKELRDDMLAVNIAEQQMEIEGDEEHDKLNAELLQEVSLPLTAVSEPISSVSVSIPPSMSIPQFAVNPDLSQPSFAFSPAVDADIQTHFAKLRAGPQTTPEISAGFSFGQNPFGQERGSSKLFNMGSVPSTYPGLDGHPRRITPIPMSTAQSGGSFTVHYWEYFHLHQRGGNNTERSERGNKTSLPWDQIWRKRPS